MAVYNHVYLYILYVYTQEVHTIASKCTNTHEAGACYTKLTQLPYRATQLPCGGLDRQPSYPYYTVLEE